MTETTTIAAIERTLTFTASRDRVWRALTDPAELGRWFPDRVDLDPIPGYDGGFTWDEHGTFAVRVVAVEPTSYLAWRWSNDEGVALDASKEQTLIEWWLEDTAGGGTTLRMKESGFTRPSHREGNDAGWNSELAELEALLA